MKINKRNPDHWRQLIVSGLNVVITSIFSYIPTNSSKQKSVVFYDQMNGNSSAFSKYLSENHPDIKQYFLAFPDYHLIYPKEKHGLHTLNILSFKDMIRVARADTVITNFGIQTLVFYTWLTRMKFIDVWHGIPYKGFAPKDFSFLRRYTEIWVSSSDIKDMYHKKFGLPKEKIVATGYARVDIMNEGGFVMGDVRKKYGIDDKYKKIILVAPTWKQDDNGRSLIPFGVSEHEFLNELNKTAKELDSLIIFRAHRGSGDGVEVKELSNMRIMPASQYPETEEILTMSDILITDWSSIAFDYLPLDRPTIFLDVDPPFRHGFSLDERYRFGEVVDGLRDLCISIKRYCNHPADYLRKYGAVIRTTKEVAYGNTLDGRSSERYYKRLERILSS